MDQQLQKLRQQNRKASFQEDKQPTLPGLTLGVLEKYLNDIAKLWRNFGKVNANLTYSNLSSFEMHLFKGKLICLSEPSNK